MKAIGLRAFGGPEVLRLLDLPQPEPGAGEVRIRVLAAAVNPTDATFRSGAGQARLLGDRPPPWIPGMDAAGVIDKLGPETGGRLAEGDPVVALALPGGPHGGAYAEQIVVPAASAVRAPANADFAAASTLLLNGAAAQLALDALKLRPGQLLAVTGAAGSLGGYAVQLAKAAGLRVVADAAPADEELVRSLGADFVVGRGSHVAAAIRAVCPGGAAGLIDGAAQDAEVVPAIADGGGLATVRGWNGPAERGIAVHPVVSTSAATDTMLLERLVRQAESGVLTLRVADVMPALDAPDAHRRLAGGGIRGRLVLDFAE
jgi:NADPH:quinone reductase-like Zn-dependent oxidoreductase